MDKVVNRVLVNSIIDFLTKYKEDLKHHQKKDIEKIIDQLKENIFNKDKRLINQTIYYLISYKKDLEIEVKQIKDLLIKGSIDKDLGRIKINYNKYYIDHIEKAINNIKKGI